MENLNKLKESLNDLHFLVQQHKMISKTQTEKDREDALLFALRSLLDSRSTPTWLKSTDDNKIVYVNPAYEKEFGIPNEVHVGTSDDEHWDDDIAKGYCDNDQIVLDTGEEREFIELVRINGVDQYYRVRKWLVAIEGVVLGIAGESLGIVHEPT